MITLFAIRPKGFNVGNDAIFLGMQRYLFEAFGEVVNIINVPATSRYESHAKAGLTPQTVWEMNLYGDGVIVGGGNLYENGELSVDPTALAALEPPMMLFSLSHGRVYNRACELVRRTNAMPAATTKMVNDKASQSLARESATLKYLHDLGATDAILGGCPTIFLDRIRDKLPSVGSHGVLISLRHPSLMSIPSHLQAEVRTDILQIIEFLKSKGHSKISLLCHDHRDIPFATSFPDVDFIYRDDIYTFLALLDSCELNITYRLHSALPCLSLGKPMIAISYDERSLSLLDTVGYGDWNIDMVRCDGVVDAVKDRYERLSELPEKRRSVADLWQKLDNGMTESFGQFAQQVRGYRDRVNGATSS